MVSQYVELATAPASLGGRLEIGSDSPGTEVRVDGVSRGFTPLVINDLAPGQHRVTLSAGNNLVNRTVNITRGATSTIVVSMPPADTGSAGGWLTIDAPIEMEILEGGRVLGTTRTDRLMLPVGSHRIEFANAGLEFTTAPDGSDCGRKDSECGHHASVRPPVGERSALGRCIHRWILCRHDTAW